MAIFTVTTLTDESVENATLSLREAVALANATAGDDEIVFASGLQGTLSLTGGEIAVTDGVTISGTG
ncbi:MAG: CSLREA domain-containing protein, partial [Pseudomonadota bacterium]